MVALFPSSLTTNGWVWIRPSWWEGIRGLLGEFGLLAGFWNAEAASSHSPQTSMFNAVCQWSPGTLVDALAARGGPLPALSLPPRRSTIATTPTMTTAAMATFQPSDPPRRRFG